MALANNLERVFFHNADAFVVFTGFDPRANDSGNKIGRRCLSKHGPAELRRLRPRLEHCRSSGNHRTQNRPCSLVSHH
ncbi:MAG: transposase [Nitrosomonadales bacterium]|nr:transposase [Nitrosomonadales bacterium]